MRRLVLTTLLVLGFVGAAALSGCKHTAGPVIACGEGGVLQQCQQAHEGEGGNGGGDSGADSGGGGGGGGGQGGQSGGM